MSDRPSSGDAARGPKKPPFKKNFEGKKNFDGKKPENSGKTGGYDKKDRPFNKGKDRGQDTPNKERYSASFHSEEQKIDTTEALAQLNKRMAGLGARRAALDILMLLRNDMDLEHALNKGRTFNILEGADRAFARNLVSTVLRQRGALDDIIGQYLDRPLPAKSIEAMDILRMSAAQTLFLKTPPHAAVATSVELAGMKRELAGYKGLINAVARKIANKGPEQLAKLPARVNTPGWLYRSWERAYGPDKTRIIAAANASAPALDLTLKPDTDIDELRTAIELATENVTISHPAPRTLRLKGAVKVAELPGYAEGKWWVQDVAATLPAQLLGNIEDKQVIDLCAAPGGKTMQLVASGAHVTAVDKAPYRLRRLRENLQRTELRAIVIEGDVLRWDPAATVDAVLLDAPCSATGTIRRNPDVTWTKTEEEVATLNKLQAQFIDRALSFLKPGGTLVYCVCSLQRSEGEAQIDAALKRHETLTLLPVTPDDIGGLSEMITPKGTIRTLPSMMKEEGGMDGFFAARLIKG